MKNFSGGAKRILVVEDEPAINAVCRRVLTSEGFEVDIAVNGKKLYQWLQEKHPQLEGRVLFTTGDVMSGDTQSFLEQIARPFLLKPFTPDELRAIVREV